ncbi:Epsin-3, clathrin recruitment and traffic between the Golgi and endosome [Stygiomarasmius scandens]|uniref:Epsin-3, clathrin recruitment and traffic between the Golgi and endosome n=1 Tax=Marasmiellus scandens TaxID=2682957 RepID=A0ABR1JHF3_9AGAR
MNDNSWGASSTLMQVIANRTFNYPDFNEIMPSIYARFMEKEARQWRQIYKALQLLEYFIKHGSKRVVKDTRSHISTIKMLRNFHYIDDKGKDQGINVRNRAKEIVELLSDVDTIHAERRKAKINKNKYTGTGSDDSLYCGSSGGGSSGGGYGSSYSSSSGYGNECSSYSASGSGFRDSSERRDSEEYDAGDDEDKPVSSPMTTSSRSNVCSSTSTSGRSVPQQKPTAPLPPPKPVKEVDQAKSMKDLGKEKASAGLWGAMGGSGNSGAKQPAMGSGMGSFGASSGGSVSGGGDDLLL